MYKLFIMANNFFKKIKRRFNRRSTNPPMPADVNNQNRSVGTGHGASNNQSNIIVIRSRNNAVTMPSNNRGTASDPRITILGINQRTTTASGTNCYVSEIEMTNRNLGGGMTVRGQRKPNTCSLCRSSGMVVNNTGSCQRWRCEVCGSTFN